MRHILSRSPALTQRSFSFLNHYLVIRNLLFLLALSMPVGMARAASEKPGTYGMEIRPATIAMADGIRLSADLYLPTGGQAGEKYPVLLEYLPYRKHEARSRDRKSG